MRPWDRIYVDIPAMKLKYVLGRKYCEEKLVFLPECRDIEVERKYIEDSFKDICGYPCYVEFDFEMVGQENK